MATDSSNRVIIWNSCDHSSAFIFDRIFFIFEGNKDNYIVSKEFEIWPHRTKGCRISCIEPLEKNSYTYNGKTCYDHPSSFILIESSSGGAVA